MNRYPKPDILQQLPARGHAIIEASAGTGKTYTLEHLIIDLLLRHPEVELENILVVTFTERATAELKVRVRRLLARVVGATRPGPGEETAPAEGASEDQTHWTIGEANRRKLERALFSFDVAPIYTIHGFCQRVLTEYAFANRRFFDQRHVEFGPLFERAFTEAMRRTLACEDDTRDWLEAWLEVGGVDELRELLARCLTSRVELWPRLREAPLTERLGRHGDDFWERYEQLYARRSAKRERAFRRAQNAWRRTRSVARFLMHADKEVLDLKYSLKGAQPRNDEEADFLRLVGNLLRFKPAVAQKFLPVMRQALAREKQRAGAYTYDDMLTMVWRGLERPGTGPWLTQTLRRRYRFALIDEFQDTDEIQWQIFRRLFVEGAAANRLFVIGDPKQAIYGWRGADVRTYLEACRELLTEPLGAPEGANDEGEGDEILTEEDEERVHDEADADDEDELDEQAFIARLTGEADEEEDEPEEEELEAGAVQLHLQQNWRSTPELIDAYNYILDQSSRGPFFTNREICYDHPVRCGDPERAVFDAAGRPVSPVVLGAMKRKEDDRSTVRTGDLYECYGRWIASQIEHLLSDEGHLILEEDGQRRRLSARDIYVLTRTHSDERRLEAFLREAQLPYALYKQGGLFQTREAREIYELLRAIERPHERGRRLRAWATAFFDVELEELIRCRDLPETHPLYKVLLEWHQMARFERFEELFLDILERTGLMRREIFFGEDERALTNFAHIAEVLLEEAHLGRLDFGELVVRCRAFLSEQRKPLSQEGDIKRLEDDRDAVQLMTMHKSKGLEAPVVFLYAFGGMAGEFWRFHYQDRQGEWVRAMHILKPSEKISPKLRLRVEEESREEDQRLLYVGITRAKARLYLPYVPYAGNAPVCKYLTRRSYHTLNKKLRQVWEDASEGRCPVDIERQEILYFGPRPTATPSPDPEALASWSPPEDHLEALEPQEIARRAGRDLSEGTQRIESYSSLKRRAGGYALAAPVDEQELRAEDELGSAEDAVGADELPGGVRTGLFLHDVLERLDYRTLTRYRDLEEWAADARVRALFVRSMREHGVEPEHLALSQRVVWRALTAIVQVDHGVIYGLGHCPRNRRELEFLYPIPETSHPPLGQLGGGLAEEGLEVERGFIKGYIDYVFEWSGRIYFADWKSDVLERYDVTTLHQHFDGNYTKQAFLYAIALCKLSDIEDAASYEARFGGAIYCFLRGMQDDSDKGLLRYRPTWDELLAFERALTRQDMGLGGEDTWHDAAE